LSAPARIREAEAAELETVAAMIRKLAEHIGTGFVPKTTGADLLAHGAAGRGRFTILVAEHEHGLVGFCLYSWLFSAWRGRPGVYLSDLYVDEAQRGAGLGIALLRAVLAREAHEDCGFILLEVDRTNASARAFYERIGFVLKDHDDSFILAGAALDRLRTPPMT
jgi:ribosomal protein S18 acetylase RimI-like enzyme